MKFKVFIFGLLLLTLSCENQNLRKNTVDNLEKCIEKNSSELLTKKLIKKNCKTKLENNVERFITGTLIRPLLYPGSPSFDITFKNNSNNIIYTGFTVFFEHSRNYLTKFDTGEWDNSGDPKDCKVFETCQTYKWKKTVSDLWIEPGDVKDLDIDLNHYKDGSWVGKFQLNHDDYNYLINHLLVFKNSKKEAVVNAKADIIELKGFYLKLK